MEKVTKSTLTSTDSSTRSTSSEASRENTLDSFMKAKKWVSQQLNQLELQNAVDTNVDKRSQTDDAEVLMNNITKLKRELLMETSNLVRREAVVQRIELGEVQLNSLIAGNEGDSGETQKHELLKELVLEKTKLSTEILKKLKFEDTQSKLDTIQRKNRMLQQENRTLMNEIKSKQESTNVVNEELSHDSDLTKYITKLERNVAKIEIQRNILQGLVFASGTDWAKDESLLKLMLTLGESLDF